MKYKFLKHTADIKFQAFGSTLEKVFENSALAVANSMYEGKVKEIKSIKFKVSGKDLEALMYNFLEEILFYFDSENFILKKIKKLKIIKKKGYALNVEISGDDINNYEINTHIKAVTYNDMFIKKQKSKWTAQVVVDI
ncbi:MAG: archease [archaeon]